MDDVLHPAPPLTGRSERGAAIRCENIVREFGKGETRVRVLHGIDLEVYPGQMTLLIGPSGAERPR